MINMKRKKLPYKPKKKDNCRVNTTKRLKDCQGIQLISGINKGKIAINYEPAPNLIMRGLGDLGKP